MDAEIQYLDLFAYFKDVLSDNNSVNYTFGSGLGQNMVAVFSYYLMSPLNLLIVFFSKDNLEIFFNLLVLIKLSIASVTFSYFLKHRFTDKIENFYIVLLSISYALCQYNISQASNIMWLDGVYMLPLIMLGVYNVVNDKKSILLICSVACSVIFNWYTGIINCLFSIMWLIFEIAIYEINIERKYGLKERTKNICKKCLRYGISMVVGGIISVCILLPTVISLQSGRGNLQFDLLKDLSFLGDLPSVIPEYTLGATSQYGKVSLFCGSLALLGCLSIIFLNKVSKKEKIIFGIFLIIIILMFYWNPFFVVFSLFKSASSYWYRYSYLGIFAILFMAAYFYKNGIEQKYLYNIMKISTSFIIILMILNCIYIVNSRYKVYLTSAFIIIITVLVILINYIRNKKKLMRHISIVLLYMLVISEITYNTSELMNIYHTNTAETFLNYVNEEEEQIAEIKNSDKGFYRITQTNTRNMDSKTNLTANYNEPLAFGYWGISSYTSDPDERQREFLEKLGYKINGENMNIVNTSILGADSFLGVKYILSNYPIKGLEEKKRKQKKKMEKKYMKILMFFH